MKIEPRLLSCPKHGLVLEYEAGRTWSSVVVRTAASVFVKKIRTAELNLCENFHYPKGIVEAARRFLHPELGVATVTLEATLVLEDIMKTYAININTGKILARFKNEKAAAAAAGEDENVKVVSSEEQLTELTLAQMKSIVAQETGKPAVFKNKREGAAVIAALAEAKKFEGAASSVGRGRPKGSSKGESVKDKIRQAFTVKKSYPREVLLEKIGCPSQSLSTAVSDLKNPKYAGGSVLVLDYDRTSSVYSVAA
jgi:hypothetical protein